LACRGGWLDVVQWLHGRCNFTREDMMVIGNWACRTPSQHTRISLDKWIDIVQWVDGICKFTRVELMRGNNRRFRIACRNGHLKVARWFDRKCQFTREELMDVYMEGDLPTNINTWLMVLCASR